MSLSFNSRNLLILLIVFIGWASVDLRAQAWNAACGGANFCDIGTIVPTSVVQTVPSGSFCAVAGGAGHSNNFNAGTSKFVKLQFAATAGQKYCFSLRTYGGGTNTGSGIEIISANCPSGSYVGTSYTAYGTQYVEMKNCLGWTAPATQTYYIQLSGGTCACNFFGCCGPTGFENEVVEFKYTTSAPGSGSCNCSSGVILPIELTRFKALSHKDGILVEWTTATETNNQFFTLEKSTDGLNFMPIGKIAGSGNSYIPKDYKTVDSNPYSGINYYRLKQTDFNGESSYSDIISVRLLNNTDWLGDVYPNPAQEKINFEVFAYGSDNAFVELTDLTGRIVYRNLELLEEGGQTLSLSISELSNGIYSLRVTQVGTGEQVVRKLIKN